MNYLSIEKESIENGIGIRVAVFFAGCLPNKCKEGNCPGCHNQEAQKFNVGQKYTDETEKHILSLCKKPYISGLTLLGGEPYDQDENQLVELLKAFHKQNPDKNVWIYTGYEFEQVKNRELTKYIDVAVVGPFILWQRDISDANRWRGSRNQKVLLVKESLEQNKLVYMPNIPNNQ